MSVGTRSLAAAGLLWMAVLAAGCFDSVDRHPADVVAVVAPDSVAEGERVEVKIFSARVSGCSNNFTTRGFERINDSTYALDLIEESFSPPPGSLMPCRTQYWFLTALPALPVGRWIVRVNGPRGVIDLPVVVGAAAALAERLSVTVEKRGTGGAVAAASVQLTTTRDDSDSSVTVAMLTDERGRADTTMTCARALRGYSLGISGGGSDPLFISSGGLGARCGIPERMVVRP